MQIVSSQAKYNIDSNEVQLSFINIFAGKFLYFLKNIYLLGVESASWGETERRGQRIWTELCADSTGPKLKNHNITTCAEDRHSTS